MRLSTETMIPRFAASMVEVMVTTFLSLAGLGLVASAERAIAVTIPRIRESLSVPAVSVESEVLSGSLLSGRQRKEAD
jgi:hypothetical protein